ncbi:MAG: hypothetical protein A2148_06630 [Chloroflexi bacterium RBG_16_68_14]|nr:MAG: hypothetical protein A2148_06630 [Chloroflexi bacterium RBG_16_68_14]
MSTLDRVPRAVGLAGAAFAGLYAYAWYAARRFEDLEPESAGAPGSFLEVDGVRLHYVEAGRGEEVLLIHGLGASTFSFRYVIPELAQRYRVVALDLKGFGYSGRPSGDYSLTAQAALVRRFMDQLDIERAVVVGHSMGGAVAMRLALGYPERVSRLVLVGSATDQELRHGLRFGRYLRPFLPLAALFTLHRQSFRRLSLRSAVHDPAHLTPEVLDGYFRPSRMKGHLRALGALAAHRRRDEPLAPERILQPTLLLWGEHDRWLPPSQGEELARRIPNGRLLLVPSAGHLPLEEQPDFCNRALLEFLASPQPAAAPLRPGSEAKLETPS